MERIQKIFELRGISTLRCFVLSLFLSIWLCSCVTYMKVAPDTKKVALIPAQTDIPESQLLDVRIEIFDPGKLPSSKNASRGLSEEIREAESHYMAIQLRNAMQQSGHWGAVRVVPSETSGDEVRVTGRILKSNGEELELKIGAIDATGQQWFKEKTFKGAVGADMYKESSKNQIEVFQNVYNKIANALAVHRRTMASEQVHEIRQVAEMRFAEELAPGTFMGYLRKERTALTKKRFRIERLPSKDDEMLERVRQVRERDYMLVDTLDIQYEGLYRDMEEVYTGWRKSRLDEMNMIREVDRKKNAERWKGTGIILAGAVLGAAASAAAAKSNNYNPNAPWQQMWPALVGAAAGVGVAKMLEADQIAEEAEINKVALEELGISFAAEVEPIVLEVEGETIKLTGSAKAKHQQWREVLARLYKVETEAEIGVAESGTLEAKPSNVPVLPKPEVAKESKLKKFFTGLMQKQKQKQKQSVPKKTGTNAQKDDESSSD